MKLIAIVLNDKAKVTLYQLTKRIIFKQERNKRFAIKYNSDIEYSIIYNKKIDSLNCIVGKNGSGKTTLLNTIFNNSKDKVRDSAFVFEKDNGQFIATGDSSIKFFYEDKQVVFIDEVEEELNLNIIKYSSSIETAVQTKEEISDNVDVSTTALLFKSNLPELNQNDMFKQVNFVLNNRESLNKDKEFINLETKKIIIDLSLHGMAISQIKKNFLEGIEYPDFLEKLGKGKKITSEFEKVIMLKFFSIIYSKLPQKTKDSSNPDQAQSTVKYNLKKSKSMHKELSEIIYEDLFSQLYKIEGENYAYEYVSKIERCYDEIERLRQHGVFSEKRKEFTLTKNTDIEFLRKVVGNYFSDENEVMAPVFSVVFLEWQGVSSGEFALLNLFGRISSGLEDCRKLNYLILLDEVDLGLHPEWQRKWVSTSLRYIAKILQKGSDKKHIQMIITTHSPILLSDILTQDVLILNDDNNRITFGQNIYTLISESFVVSDTMGEFSSSIISIIAATLRELIKLQEQGDQNKKNELILNFYKKLNIVFDSNKVAVDEKDFFNYLKYLINSIGEDVIRVKLMEMMNRCLPKETQRNELIEKIEELRAQLDRIGD